MRSRVLGVFALVLSLIGFGASVASLFDYLAPAPRFCAESGCETVRNSAWAAPLGIPLPILGIAYFAAMSVLAFVPRRRLRIALAAIGGGVGIALIAIQAFEIGAWCQLCLIADPAAILGAIAVIGGAGTLRPTWPNIGATVPAATLVVLALGLYSNREGAIVSNEPVPEFVAREQQRGTVTIVEFLDFECPHCRALDKQLSVALERTKRSVRIVRKMMPLANHRYSIPAAMAWCAADAQGKGDEMAKELFAARPEDLTPAGCEAIAVRLGCDVTKYSETFASAEVRQRVGQDMADFRAANLNGLPTIYIGTQKLEGADHSSDTLLAAIERAAN